MAVVVSVTLSFFCILQIFSIAPFFGFPIFFSYHAPSSFHFSLYHTSTVHNGGHVKYPKLTTLIVVFYLTKKDSDYQSSSSLAHFHGSLATSGTAILHPPFSATPNSFQQISRLCCDSVSLCDLKYVATCSLVSTISILPDMTSSFSNSSSLSPSCGFRKSLHVLAQTEQP